MSIACYLAMAVAGPVGPRIDGFGVEVRALHGAPGLLVTATLLPDEHALPGRPISLDQVKVSFNGRTIKHALYAFDAGSGAFSLALDAPALEALERGRTPHADGLALQVTTAEGQARKETSLPGLERLLRQLMGPEAPMSWPKTAYVAGRLGAPGGGLPAIGLRLDHEMLPATAGPRSQAALLGTGGEGLAALVGERELVSLAGKTPTEAFPPGLLALQLRPERATAFANGQGKVTIQGPGRFEVPGWSSLDGTFAATSRLVVLPHGAGALEARAWDGKVAWVGEPWPSFEHGTVALAASDLEVDQEGFLEASVGRGSLYGVTVPFLAVRQLAPDGSTAASALIVDPAPGEFKYVEDVQVARFHGRVFAVVTSSRATGFDLQTRIFDMGGAGGEPVLTLGPGRAGSPWWSWGAVVVGDRLAIGRGAAGVAFLAPAARAAK